MREIRTDRRVARSREALCTAFVKLMLQDGYDTVTVEAVAARANVGRSTFYLHFRGKEDILRQSMMTINRVLACVLDDTIAGAQMVPLLQHFYEQRRINHVFLTAPVRALWVRYLADEIEAKIAARRGAQLALPIRLVALYLAEVQVGLITQWLLARAPVKPARIAEALLATTRATAAALLTP